MKKISIILPIYNSERYIKKCLNSIINQLNIVCELIVINDGSVDQTVDIVEEYKLKYNNIKIYNIEHNGISYARNYGISKVKSEYFIFVDSDDYIADDLIEKMYAYLDNNYDLIRFQAKSVLDNKKSKKIDTKFYGEYTGVDFLNHLCENNEIFGPPWLYCYNTSFFRKNKFQYACGKVQEDFGLTPLIISKANKIISIDYIGYFYYQSDNSIMRNDDYNKTLQKFFDVLFHYDFLMAEFNKMNINNQRITLYLNSVVCAKYKKLKNDDKVKYKILLDRKEISTDENK